jgi:hypothetical protein
MANDVPTIAMRARRSGPRFWYREEVKSHDEPARPDHYLVARAQACVTGANAHELHALLGIYHGLCLLGTEDESVRRRIESVEQRIRAFCQSVRLIETRADAANL